MQRLTQFNLVYLGTPYSKYADGLEAAFREACVLTGKLIAAGVRAYSPIAHTHPVAIHAGLDPLDHNIWLPYDEAIMARCDAMVVGTMIGWRESYGVKYEIDTFRKAGKPVFMVSPETLDVSLCECGAPKSAPAVLMAEFLRFGDNTVGRRFIPLLRLENS